MGTDIHLAVEVREDDDSWRLVWDQASFYEQVMDAVAGGEEDYPRTIDSVNLDWIFDHPFYIERNYALFYRLGGLRYGPDEPFFGLRGMPVNASEETKKWYADEEDYGVHSLSYLYLSELLSVSWDRTENCETCESREPIYGRFRDKTLPALRRLGDPDDVRVVFFFDS